MNHIIPAILATDEADFRAKFAMLDEVADTIQLDALDNTLYPNTSWCDTAVIDALDTSAWIELHLMMKDPAAIIERLHRGGPVHRVLWHIEAPIDHADLLLTCQNLGIEAGLAIAPRTSIEALAPFAEMLDEILVLGVEPGFSGQQLIPETIQKARDIHARWNAVILGFDGGTTTRNIAELRSAGITRFCVASAIWNTSDPKEAYEELRTA